MTANITVQLTGQFSGWAKALFALIRAAPWAFRWIGEERLANFVVKYGFRVVVRDGDRRVVLR